MKKRNLNKLMMAGILAGVLVSNKGVAEDKASKGEANLMDLVKETGGNVTFHQMTEDELRMELNEEGTKAFDSLSPEGKKLALDIASRSCAGTNDCKGQNACASEKNKCLGQGSCKGKTVCGISDKNTAVKMATKIMAEKRTKAQQSR